MGRLTTSLAATATHADNLPGALPNVSMLDLLLPRSFVASRKMEKPLNASSNSLSLPPATAIGDAEIKRDRKGRLIMVRHKGASIYGGGRSVAGSDVITFEDIKKSVEKMKEQEGDEGEKSERASKKGDGTKEGKKEDKKDEAKNAAEDGRNAFTADEDAKLRELKALDGKQFKSWVQISEEMGRDVMELKSRWRELQKVDKEGDSGDKKAGDKRGDEKSDKDGGKGKGGKGKKADEGEGDDKKAYGGKGGKGGQQKLDRFVFTEEDDKALRECQAAGTDWRLTAKALHKPRDACQKRWEELGGDKEAKKEEPKKEDSKKDDETDKTSSKSNPKSNTKKSEPKKGERKNEEPKKDAARQLVSLTKTPSKAASVTSSTHSTRSSIKFSIREWRALQEDDFFSFDELQILCQLIGKTGDRSWLKIASGFHDHTGRRVHPEDIREKFEAMGTVG